MSRLTELKKQYPHLAISFFDLLVRMDKSNSYKYLPVLCKIFSKRFDYTNSTPENSDYISDSKSTLFDRGIQFHDLNENEIAILANLSDYWDMDTYNTLVNFMDYMDRQLLTNKDVTSYKSIDEIRKAITLASMKEMDKELEKQVVKEYEDEKWVMVRPLTFSSSTKYGSSTRWCTTYEKEKQYFEKYWRRGILVYFINKETGYKFAGFKSLDEDYELSFWNAEDRRVDYLELEIDDYLFSIIKKIFKSDKTNKNLCSDELQETVHQECLRNTYELGGLMFTSADNRITFTTTGNAIIGNLNATNTTATTATLNASTFTDTGFLRALTDNEISDPDRRA